MTQPSREMWEERYGSEDFVFGTEPNDFLRENVGELPTGEDLLEVVFVEECVRAVIEGPGHTGDGAVVQFIARKGN